MSNRILFSPGSSFSPFKSPFSSGRPTDRPTSMSRYVAMRQAFASPANSKSVQNSKIEPNCNSKTHMADWVGSNFCPFYTFQPSRTTNSDQNWSALCFRFGFVVRRVSVTDCEVGDIGKGGCCATRRWVQPLGKCRRIRSERLVWLRAFEFQAHCAHRVFKYGANQV